MTYGFEKIFPEVVLLVGETAVLKLMPLLKFIAVCF
jgi:hypothetical protein